MSKSNLAEKKSNVENNHLKIVEPAADDDTIALVTDKINKELEGFEPLSFDSKYSMMEKGISQKVASYIIHFCEQNPVFASVVLNSKRTIADCCYEILQNADIINPDGSEVSDGKLSNFAYISDIDVYRAAAKNYFPNSEIEFVMNLQILGDVPDEEYLNSVPDKPEKPPEPERVPYTPPPPKPKPQNADSMQISLF